jgi:hypothetical protein
MDSLGGEAPFSTLCAVASGDYEGKKYVITTFEAGEPYVVF